MSRFYPVFLLAFALALPLALGGCAGLLVVGGLGAAASGGYAAAQERGINGANDDLAVQTEIEKAFLQTNPQLRQGVTSTVYNGRVLLTGRVDRPELKIEAKRLASAVPGVQTLYDEVEVAPAEGAWDSAKDAWITARVRSELILDPNIRSANYTLHTENGSVYLIGSARSQDELDQAARLARYVPGVKRVVSYVEIRSGSSVAAGSAGLAPFARVPGAGAPSAAATAPIEAQKL